MRTKTKKVNIVGTGTVCGWYATKCDRRGNPTQWDIQAVVLAIGEDGKIYAWDERDNTYEEFGFDVTTVECPFMSPIDVIVQEEEE